MTVFKSIPIKLNSQIQRTLLYGVIFLMAFIPRVLALDAFVAPDEGKWIYRSAHFLRAGLAGELDQMTSIAATPDVEVLAPAVPTMWTGALGLAAKYWVEEASPSDNLADYLQAIPARTEKIPLHFYPWTRFPTVLLTSLTILFVYILLARLLNRGVALVATLLLALDPFFIGLSRVIHHDALLSIFITLSLLTLLLYRRQNNAGRWLILSGVAGGLALLTKPTAMYLVLFVAIFLLWAGSGPPRPASTGGSTPIALPRLRASILAGLIWGGVALVTFVALWPAMWVAPANTLAALFDRAVNAMDGSNDYSLIPRADSPLPELGFLFYPVNWLFKATLPQFVGLVALVIGWRRGWLAAYSPAGAESTKWAVKRFTLFTLLFLLLLVPADTRDIRYFLPAVPALYVLAAVGLFLLAARVAARGQPSVTGVGQSQRDDNENGAKRVILSDAQARAKNLQDRSKRRLFGLRPQSDMTNSIFRGVGRQLQLIWPIGLLLAIQLLLAALYFPYFVNYWNPVIGGPWLAPHLVKIGSGEGLDRMGRYLSQKSNASDLTVATGFWESFVPFFPGHYTKADYDDEADYIVIYRRQIQNGSPFPEYWTYFSARPPERKVSLVGLDYAWLYPGPQLRVVREAEFGGGLALRGYRLDRPAAEPGEYVELTIVWAGVTPEVAGQTVTVELVDETGLTWVQGSGSVLAADGPSTVEGHYGLVIPPELARGNYNLRVSVGDISRVVGTIPVRHLEMPPIQYPAQVNFGDRITFVGANVSPASVPAKQPIELELVWQARQPVPFSYTTFVHLVDEAGQIWGQVDRLPGDGRWPTTEWEKGEWIIDRFELHPDPNTPPGDYRLLVGIYDSQTLERLPIIGLAEGQTVVAAAPITILSE